MSIFGKQPKYTPPPPPLAAPLAATTADANTQAGGDGRLRGEPMGGTNPTGGQGLTAPVSTTRKSLLGG